MLVTLIKKEMMHHMLSVRFVALLLMCLLLIPLTFSINHSNYRQRQVSYQESLKLARSEAPLVRSMLSGEPPEPTVEVSKLFLKPSPLSVFVNGMEEVLPSYFGMTRNGITQGVPALASATFSYILGQLDFLFLISNVFSLLALLFTFDAVAGEKETGTIRITLANALPRDMFLWSKLIGGYLVFVAPFLVSFIFGLLVLVWQGYPLGEPEILGRVLVLTFVSLLYIAVFFAIGLMISTYLDTAKTSLIVTFTLWVFVVLIAPRLGFLAAKVIAPMQTEQSIYMQKTVLRKNLAKELEHKKFETLRDITTGQGNINFTGEMQKELTERMSPIEETYRLKLQNESGKINRKYQREKRRQEFIGKTLSRVTPTASLIYLATNLAQTGDKKKNSYSQEAEHYYSQLDAEYFSKMSNYLTNYFTGNTGNVYLNLGDEERLRLPPAPTDTSLADTFRHSFVDLLLLCFFVVILATVAFLKFLRLDI